MDRTTDKAPYLKTMQAIDSGLLEEVLGAVGRFSPSDFGEHEVEAALSKSRLDIADFAALLSPSAEDHLDLMTARAREVTRNRFGDRVTLFTPLYISNHCVNRCAYCGFQCGNDIRRAKLDTSEIARELDAIAASGLEEVLILTGESRRESGIEYVGDAVKLAAKRFRSVGIEIYPVNVDEYAYLRACGAEYVCVFQETYNPERYAEVHPKGPKRVYSYRFDALERALLGGMKSVNFGALLGLADFRQDAFATGLHAHFLQHKYPDAGMALSVPRLRPYINHGAQSSVDVRERDLLQVMLAYRLFLPYAGITISTRERAEFRDRVIGVCATKISAGVSVGIGGHDKEEEGDGQFEIADRRSVSEVQRAIIHRGLQPVQVRMAGHT